MFLLLDGTFVVFFFFPKDPLKAGRGCTPAGGAPSSFIQVGDTVAFEIGSSTVFVQLLCVIAVFEEFHLCRFAFCLLTLELRFWMIVDA